MISRKKVNKLQLPSIESILETEPNNRIIYLRFYNPISAGEWLVWGVEYLEKDIRFYGRIVMNNSIVGYFLLSELKKIILPFGLSIEWDEEFVAIKDSIWISENGSNL